MTSTSLSRFPASERKMPTTRPMLAFIVCLLLFIATTAQTATWKGLIPNGVTGNPTVREFQVLVNIPTTPFNVLFSGVTYNGTTYDLPDTWV